MSAAPVCVKCGCCPAYQREGETATLCLFCEDGLPCAGEQRRKRAEKLAALRSPAELRKQEARKPVPPRHELKKAEEKRKRKAKRAVHAKGKPTRSRQEPKSAPTIRLPLCEVPLADPKAPRKGECEICSAEFVGSKRRRYCDDCIAKLQATAKSARPNPRSKYAFTTQQDARIREVYALKLGAQKKISIKGTLEKEFGIPGWRILRRARQIGLSRTKEKPWSRTELELLDRSAWKTDGIISGILRQAGYQRTPTAVHVMLTRRVGRKREQYPFYSATGLSKLVGVDAHVITGWIEHEWLKAGGRATERTARQGGDPHEIWPYDVYEFIREHPEEIDLRKVDQGWFLELMLHPEKRTRSEEAIGEQVDTAIAKTLLDSRRQLRTPLPSALSVPVHAEATQ